MLFAAFVVAASAASAAYAQSLSGITLTQCSPSTVTFDGSAGPYYAAVVPATDACTSDPFAEYNSITDNSLTYTPQIPAGTVVQVYVADQNGNEYWSDPITVADGGDSSCLPGSSSSSSDSSTSVPVSTSSSTSSSATTTPTAYVVPNNVASSATRSSANVADTNDDTSTDNTPANAATNGASSATVSFALVGGAIFAAAALF